MIEAGEDIGLYLTAKMDDEVDVTALRKEVNEVLAKHGYKIATMGSWSQMRRLAIDEEEFIKTLLEKHSGEE